MVDIFNIAVNAPLDKSIQYLRQVFGLMGGVLDDPAAPLGGDSTNLVSEMFKTFNTVMLAVGALIVVYVIVVGAMKTAHEGEAMGKQWNSLWIPIRIVLGIAGLFPTASGYCLIQIAMMWVIVQGIGAADSLWFTVVNSVNKLGSPYAQIVTPSTGVSNSMRDLFKALTCDETMRRTDLNPQLLFGANGIDMTGVYGCSPAALVAPGFWGYCTASREFVPDIKLGTINAYNTPYTYNLGPEGICGKLHHCNLSRACGSSDPASNESSLQCKTCKASLDALALIIPQQRELAKTFVQADYDYRAFYNLNPPNKASWIKDYCTKNNITKCCISNDLNQCSSSDAFPSPNASGPNGAQNASTAVVKQLIYPYEMKKVVQDDNFITVHTRLYLGAIEGLIKQYTDAKKDEPPTLDPAMQESAKTGWLYAGAFYYVVGRRNSENQQTGIPTFAVTTTPNALNKPPLIFIYRSNLTAARDLISAMLEDTGANPVSAEGGEASASADYTGGGGLSGDASLGDAGNLIAELKNDLGTVFTTGVLPSNTNPIFAAQAMGFALLIILEFFFAAFLFASVILGLVGNINVFVAGNAIMDPIGPMATLVFLVLVPALYGLMGIMATYGGMLGVYVPLIPFMIYTAAAVTWFLMVLETMVAGPLVAIGIMMPSGHHEMMGKAEPALLMLLNIFLRPSLMIFGLMVGMLLSTVVCDLIFYTFWSIFIPKAGQPGLAFLAWVFYMGAFVALVVAAINKCYAAIYMLPERVITWIGGHAAQGGEAEMAGEGKRAIEGAAQSMGSAAKTVGEAPHGIRKAEEDAKRSVNEQKKPPSTGGGTVTGKK